MEFIVEEILSAIFDGLLYGRKVPKAEKYILLTLLSGFVLGIFVLCAIIADITVFRVFCAAAAVVTAMYYTVMLRKIHRNEINDDI